MQKIPQSMDQVTNLYNQIKLDKNIKNLKTVLRKYILPFLPTYEFSFINSKDEDITFHLHQISVQDFRRAKPEAVLNDRLNVHIAAGDITKRTADSYRSEFKLFTEWMQEQDWYISSVHIWDGKCAPLIRLTSGSDLQRIKRTKQRSKNKSLYALKKSELTQQLEQEIEDFSIFWIGKEIEGRQDRAMRPKTLQRRKDNILNFLGWLKNIEKWPEDQLSLALLEDIQLVKKMVRWGINTRGNSYAWAIFLLGAAIAVAKWRHGYKSEKPKYRDIDEIERLRLYRLELNGKYVPSLPIEEKELTHEQCVTLVRHLKKCTVPKTSDYKVRSPRAVMQSRQRHLIIAILTYCPIRGREIRELQLNRTLSKDPNGQWCLVLNPDDHKNGSKTGKGREINLSEWLPPEIITDLNEWVTVHRPQVYESTQDLNQWLAFWQHHISELETLPVKIQTKYQTGRTKYGRSLERELQGLHNLIESWEDVKNQENHNYVFFSLGSNQNTATVYRPFCHPSPDIDDARTTQFVSMVENAVETATAVLAESEHPLFVGVNPKTTNPHFFRHIGSTHIRRKKTDQDQLKAFHEGIGNSVTEGDRSYNLMSLREKTAAGAGWWKSEQPSEPSLSVAKIQKLIATLSPAEKEQLRFS